MDYANLKKQGSRKPLVADGKLSFGAHSFVDGHWAALRISITEAESPDDDTTRREFVLEVGRQQAIDVANFIAGILTNDPDSTDRRTAVQRLRDLADLLDSESK